MVIVLEFSSNSMIRNKVKLRDLNRDNDNYCRLKIMNKNKPQERDKIKMRPILIKVENRLEIRT